MLASNRDSFELPFAIRSHMALSGAYKLALIKICISTIQTTKIHYLPAKNTNTFDKKFKWEFEITLQELICSFKPHFHGAVKKRSFGGFEKKYQLTKDKHHDSQL